MRYFKNLITHISEIRAYDSKGKPFPFAKMLNITVNAVNNLNKRENKIIIIGNGGSASIASHLATDFLKNAGIPAIAFNDASLITCVSNDLGYENVFARPIQLLSKPEDILIAVSSSGKSQNILNAVRSAKDKGCFVITLSGFNKNNPLMKMGDINFFVSSNSYGFVEIVHLSICHCIVDTILQKNG